MKSKSNILPVVIMMIIGACARLIPHMPNFSPTESLAIFGAAYLGRNILAYIFPMITMYITDLVINNTIARPYFPDHEGMVLWSNYMLFNALAIVSIVFFTTNMLQKITLKNVFLSAIASSIIFFLITNFGALWSPTSLYTKDLSGLMTSYVAGLPFFRTTLLANLLFTGVIFGSMYLLTNLIQRREEVA